MLKKVIAFDLNWQPETEFIEFLSSKGYSMVNSDCWIFNDEVISYIESKLISFKGASIYKGKRSNMFLNGFSGFASILEVDTDRSWEFANISDRFVGEIGIAYLTIEKGLYGKSKLRRIFQ